MTLQPDYDVVIAGGGMTGASLAVALTNENIRIAVIEAVPSSASHQPSYDDRGLALSLSSQRILKRIEIWDKVSESACPVEHIHVSDQNHFGFVRMHAESLHVPALGYVVIARELGRVLLKKVNSAKNIDLICPATVEDIEVQTDQVMVHLQAGEVRRSLSGRLLVVADGSPSKICDMLGIAVNKKDYGQTAIVTNVTPQRPHQNTAWERFTPYGPLALLPLHDDRCAVVFTVNHDDKEKFIQMNDAEFINHLQSRLGRRLGTLQRSGSRKSYAMLLNLVKEQVRERIVVLGNSAHTIHPNGAQGFNLCLRDIAGLVEVLVPAIRAGDDPGRRQVLNQYLGMREQDQNAVIRFTDSLTGLFYNDLPHKVILRNMGMLFLDTIPPLKKVFVQKAMGIYGHQPALVRGVPVCR